MKSPRISFRDAKTPPPDAAGDPNLDGSKQTEEQTKAANAAGAPEGGAKPKGPDDDAPPAPLPVATGGPAAADSQPLQPKGLGLAGINDGPLTPARLAKPGEKMFNCIVPKAFSLTTDQHQKVLFPQGIIPVPESLTKHWWAVAHGLKVQNEIEAAKAAKA